MDWEPAERVQKNDQGEFRALIGGEWVPVAKAQKNDQGQFRVMRDFASDLNQAEQVQSQGQMSHQAPAKPDFGYAKNIPMGALAGATDIGSTLLSPIDMAMGYDRKKDLKQFYEENANPDSLAFQGGRLGTQIAGTAGVGGVLGKGAELLKAAPKLVNALKSGGFSLGAQGGNPAVNMATRMGAGGAVGATQAGMINPDDYKTGALLGAILPPGVRVAESAGHGVARLPSVVLGSTTGTGEESVRAAYQAGKSGDKAFLSHMRGQAEFDDVVKEAKVGLSKMRETRANAYRSGMVDISKDKTVLDMQPILQDVLSVQKMGYYKGQPIQKNASGTVDEINEVVNRWAGLDPKEYHTPEGMDALKRAIGDIRDGTQFGTPARKAADQAYQSVKRQIDSQAPTYSKVMKDYSQASETLDEITRTLSLGDKAAKDTAVRKLQSLLRNNAQTNYGNRLDMMRELEDQGGVSLMPSLAGQSMNTWTPRGMTGAITKAGIPFAGGGLAMSNPAMLPLLAIGAAGSSPRLIGETSYALGSGVGGLNRMGQAVTDPLKQFAGNNARLIQLRGLLDFDKQALMRAAPIAIGTSP